MQTRSPALVVNSKRNALPVMRSLASRGVKVVAVDHFPNAIGFYSRMPIARELVSLVTDGEAEFASEIAEIAKRHGERVALYPTSDAHLLAFSRQWSALESCCIPVFETNLDVLNRCLDKTRVIELAATAEVPIPQTLVSPKTAKAPEIPPFPVIVKPHIRSSPEAIAAGVFRLRVCNTTRELQSALDELSSKDFPAVVQQLISGDDDMLYTTGVFAMKGNVIAHFTGRKLRQFPPGCGECSFGEIVNEPRIIEYANRLMSEAGYTGIAQIEFKRHDDEFYLIEINPRIWSWASLATRAGVDLPWISYRCLVDGDCSTVRQRRWSGTWSYLGEDLRADRSRTPPVGRLKILRDALSASAHSIGSLSDPLPGVVQTLCDLGIKVPRWPGIKAISKTNDRYTSDDSSSS